MNVVLIPWHNTALQAVTREKQNSKLKKKGFFFPWVSSLPTGRVKGVEISPGLSLKKD